MNKPVPARIYEFVQYHINGDGECNNVALREWADRRRLSGQERYELAYFFAITYAVESAIILFEEQRELLANVNVWAARNKSSLVFQSDRKYVKMRDSFERCVIFFMDKARSAKTLEKWIRNGVIDLREAIPGVEKWPMFGRFSAFLFLETYVALTGLGFENASIEWKRGNTATSGLMNVFGYDEQANAFDKTGRLLIDEARMDKMLAELTRRIESGGGDSNVTQVETSLCAYRKFYKGTRYNGYYLDRMLEEIYKMQKNYPAVSAELLDIREKCFPRKYLGEKNGWRGIRPRLKKLYLETGMVT